MNQVLKTSPTLCENNTSPLAMRGQGKFYETILISLIALVPFIAVISPRALAILTPLVGLLVYITFSVANKKVLPLNKQTVIWLSAILGLIGLSSLWAINVEETWHRVFKIAPIFLGTTLFISSIDQFSTHAMRFLSKALPITLALSCLFILGECVNDGFVTRLLHDTDRFTGTSFLNRSVVALFFCVLPLFLKSQRAAIDFLPFFLVGLVIMTTDSQSIQLAAALFIVTGWTMPVRYKWAWLVIAIGMVGVFLSIPFWMSPFFDIFASTFENHAWLESAYATDRLEIWSAIAMYALDHPILGHGIEATKFITHLKMDNIYFPKQTVLHPHNFMLQIWIEFGALGASLGSGFLCWILYKIWGLSKINVKSSAIALAIFLSFVLTALTTYGLWQGWWLGLFGYVFVLSMMMMRMHHDLPVKTTETKI